MSGTVHNTFPGKWVGAQFLPGILDAKAKVELDRNIAHIYVCLLFVCLFLHKLASNMPGSNWQVTSVIRMYLHNGIVFD